MRHVLERLSTADFDFLLTSEAGQGLTARDLWDRPALAGRLIAQPELFDRVFEAENRRLQVDLSPFLAFMLLLERTRRDVSKSASVSEWVGARKRLPVLDPSSMAGFLDDPEQRYFLAEVLASFTKVASGSVWRRTSHGYRRRRFSELNPVQLVELLEGAAAAQRPLVLRRLGDLALFLTGVFPDHTTRQGFTTTQMRRLAAAARMSDDRLAWHVGERPDRDPIVTMRFVEELGSRWYRMAAQDDQLGWPLEKIADHFEEARRVLNLTSDRYLFRFDPAPFPPPDW